MRRSAVLVSLLGLFASTARADGPATLAIGGYSACGFDASGEVRCAGSEDRGELGSPSVGARPTDVVVPRVVPGVRAKALALGDQHACALREDGSVVCWGRNEEGQLGDGTRVDRSEPRPVPGLDSVSAIAAGSFFTCALRTDGSVSCFGYNRWGELGVAGEQEPRGIASRDVPAPVPGVRGAVAIAAGNDHACARLGDGSVVCWGSNDWAQIGTGRRGGPKRPTVVRGVRGAVELALGAFHSCARLATGGTVCWGHNVFGASDLQAQVFPRPVPVVGLETGVRSLVAGGESLCAILDDGRLSCAGVNEVEQLGRDADGYAIERQAPLPDVAGVRAAVLGRQQLCIRESDAGFRCRGLDANGQLGVGRATNAVPSFEAVRW